MSQDVRVTELNEARQTEEILLSDDEKEDTNFKEAIKGVPKQSGTDSEASQQTSQEDNNPELLASKEGSIQNLPLSSEEDLVDEDDKKEEKSENKSCKSGSKVSGDDSDSESDGENAQGKNPGQNLHKQVRDVDNVDDQNEDREDEGKREKDSNENKGRSRQ